MLLKELRQGQRFEFSDKGTVLQLAIGVLSAPRAGVSFNYTAAGTFKYLRNAEDTCPVLLDEVTGREITALSNTYQRSVIVLF